MPRRIVAFFNTLDLHDGFIDTSEAEQVVERVEALVAAVGLHNDGATLTGRRAW